MKDHDYVNFSQEHELNHHLEKVGKSKGERNRLMLTEFGKALKIKLDTRFLTHEEFREYISEPQNLILLDDPEPRN
jgi:hypothetical protein